MNMQEFLSFSLKMALIVRRLHADGASALDVAPVFQRMKSP